MFSASFLRKTAMLNASPAFLALLLSIALSACDASVNSDVSSAETHSASKTTSPTPLYDVARELPASRGLEAAVESYEVAARGDGQTPPNGVAAVVLWNHYEKTGEDALAAEYQRQAESLFGDQAWKIWAFQSQDHDNAAVSTLMRLQIAKEQGSVSAADEFARLTDTLHKEAAAGNEAARQALRALEMPAL